MRRNHYISKSLVLLFALAAVCSCDIEPDSRGGISFGVKSGDHSTKASYSGVKNSDNYERIDWSTGDVIRIYSDEASSPAAKYADYVVSSVSAKETRYSIAKVEKKSDDLCWGGDKKHYFYCAYPAPGSSVTKSVGKNEIKGSIPAAQKFYTIKDNTSTSGRQYELVPDLSRYLLMAGYAESKPIDKVDIDFYPITSCMDFTITNGTGASIEITELALISGSGDEALSGDFTCSYSGGFTVTKGSSSDSSVYIPFTDDCYITLPDDETSLRFKFFVNPANDLTNPVFKVTTSDGQIRQVTLKKPGNVDFVVTASHKTDITGVVVKDGFVLLGFDEPILLNWETTDDLPVAFDNEYAYYQYGLDNFSALSIRDISAEGGTVEIDGIVSYKVAYSDPNAKIAVMPEVTYASDWLGGDVTKTSDNPPTYKFTFTASANPADTPLTKNVAYHKEVLKNTPQTYTDVSLYNPPTGYVSSSSSGRNTANCYVINAPGTYKIPMVYGNAIKEGSPNPGAYTYSGSSTSNIMRPNFLNHSGSNINSPYIKNVVGTGSTYTAEVVWTEVSGLISNVGVNNDSIDNTGNGFVTFTVDSNNIAQGNAIIALKYGGTTVWSWHIWVTDESLVPVNGFMPVNLGWCATDTNPIVNKLADPRSSTVTISFGDDQSYTVDVFQSGKEEPYGNQYPSGTNPYYQWGRKDPMVSGQSQNNTSGRIAVNVAIQNPGTFYTYPNGSSYSWVSNYYNNLWNANTNSSKVDKTVYDPCPAGFTVPLQSDLSNLVSSSTMVPASGTFCGYVMNGLYFPAMGYYHNNGTSGISNSGTYGRYWTDRIYSDERDNSYTLNFTNNNNPKVDSDNSRNNYGQANGMCVRPELEK